MADLKQLVETLWRPHLGALGTMVTAADYDGIFNLIAGISLDIAIEAALTTANARESET